MPTGTTGNDVLWGSGAWETFTGLAGDDKFVAYGSTGFDIYDGGDGYDTIASHANGQSIGIISLTGVERITGAGFNGVSWGVTLSGSTGADVLNFSNVQLLGIDSINAGNGNDIVYGSAGTDVIFGGAGTDTIDYSNASSGVTI